MAELDHELGNVVSSLLGMARLLRESALSAEQDFWLEAIEDSGRQLGRLVEAFRQRAFAPERPIRVRPMDFDGLCLLEQVMISHSLTARSAGNQLVLIVSPALSRLWRTDDCLLRQVLDNLLGNALKATRSGMVIVEAASEISGRSGQNTLILTVTDSGPGVDEALGEQVFDAYRQGAGSGSGGRGLGLFICRNIARAMGGRIDWSNLESGGARFMLRLPGIVTEGPEIPIPAPRLLRALHCRLRLAGPVRASIASILDRLGVRRSQDGVEGLLREQGMSILIEEATPGPGNPGPELSLRVAGVPGGATSARRIQAPILECTLGPLLLKLALEGLIAPDAEPG